MSVEVIIIGGGIAGCSVAMELCKRGADVTVVDRDQPGSGATGASAGMLAPQYESPGPGPGFQFGVGSRLLWPEFARELEEYAGWSVAYRSTGMLVANRTLEEEEEAARSLRWQHEAGLTGEMLTLREAQALHGGVNEAFSSYVWLPKEAYVDVQRLAVALADAVRGAGGRVLAGREVGQVVSEGNRATGVRLLDGTEMQAHAVVLAGGAWSAGLGGLPRSLPIQPLRGQMLRLLPEGPIPEPLLANHAGRYLVPRGNGTILVGSTMEEVGFDDSTTNEGQAVLIDFALDLFPGLVEARVVEHWAGLRPVTPDTWPVLGPEPQMDGLFYASGYGRNGILFAPLAARSVADLVLDGHSEVDWEPFRVDRFPREN